MLSIEDIENTDAAFQRGEKTTLDRLGDGPVMLRADNHPPSEHDKIHDALCRWLGTDLYGLRAPGVRENLFRLSRYLSKKGPKPTDDVLLFLHAYIFALEGFFARTVQQKRKERAERHRPRKVHLGVTPRHIR